MIRLAAALSLLAAPALAGTNCAPIDQVVARLTDGYGEHIVWEGITAAPLLMQVWGNADTGSWTLVILDADGVACVSAYGDDWALPVPQPRGVDG